MASRSAHRGCRPGTALGTAPSDRSDGNASSSARPRQCVDVGRDVHLGLGVECVQYQEAARGRAGGL
jgi:hypothetical protein